MRSDWQDHIDSLPVPGRDEPPPMRELKPEELAVIKQHKKTRTRHDWSNPAEDMMMRVLEGAFGAKNVTRQSDQQRSYQDKAGKWHYFYGNSGKPDISFAALYKGELKDGVMEVKSISPSSNGWDVTTQNIKKQQIREMEKNKAKGKLCLWGLVAWEKRGVARCFVVEHDRFMQIIKDLPLRASGNFQGMSLRRNKDLDLLDDCEVLKTNRWYLPGEHWWNDEG